MQVRNEMIESNICNNGEECDTIFYQGLGSSQVQALKYVGNQKIQATTGQMMWCTGRNKLPPINVIYKLHIGTEIADVNLHPFDSAFSYFNPVKLVNAAITYNSNRVNGFHFSPPIVANAHSVVFHTINFAEFSIGQDSDIISHRKKYDSWKNSEKKSNGLILFGSSRGTAATFCAFAKYKYPEVKLVILEGAIDSVPKIIPNRMSIKFKSNLVSNQVTNLVNNSLAFFNQRKLIQYRPDGPSPIDEVANFPEGVPVVFITSKIDTAVPCSNTENIAQALANKGKNDVYLLKLERSNHPSYMFNNAEDRSSYESFIHAIYRKYHLKYDPDLAEKGEKLLEKFTLHTTELSNSNKL